MQLQYSRPLLWGCMPGIVVHIAQKHLVQGIQVSNNKTNKPTWQNRQTKPYFSIDATIPIEDYIYKIFFL